MYKKFGKRLFDVVASILFILLFWWVYGILYVLIRKNLGTPVFYSQERPGLNEKIYKMYKFRSMTDERNEKGEPLPDEKRLTPFGKKLRSSSLDELPEIWNVLKGEMSFVGPRPLLVKYLPLYNDNQKRRHNVKPGITGWAQVNGRNTISWERKFELDVEYVEKYSILIDMKILLLTVKKVLMKEGITQRGEATALEFRGGKSEENTYSCK